MCLVGCSVTCSAILVVSLVLLLIEIGAYGPLTGKFKWDSGLSKSKCRSNRTESNAVVVFAEENDCYITFAANHRA